MSKEFLKRGWKRYSRLGRKRKKIRVWRRAAGRQNKMRERKRGYTNIVSIGYGREKSGRGKVQDKVPVMVHNLKELAKVKKTEIVIIANVGKKKKMEIAKKANEMKLDVQNLNVKRFLKKAERKAKQIGNLKNGQAVLKKEVKKEEKKTEVKTKEEKKK
ncbi:MAG: eL32 family ribosomal protein [Nanoarchaeota archaeon]|nr:eL32 family ribosomal protein [Nanoarchaeota archaeon]